MDIETTVRHLADMGVGLSISGSDLRVVSSDKLTTEQIFILKENKEQLIKFLSSQHSQGDQNNSGCLIQVADGEVDNGLFFVHPIGGTVACYWPLADGLGLPYKSYGLQVASIDEINLSPLASVKDMAADYVKLIVESAVNQPYHLCGWSFGGVVALEIAAQLRKAGYSVGFLGLIDSSLEVLNRNPCPSERELLILFVRDLFRSSYSLNQLRDELKLSNRDFTIAEVYQQCNSVQLLPSGMDILMFKRLYQVFKCNTSAHNSYLPEDYLGEIQHYIAVESTDFDNVKVTNAWLHNHCAKLSVHQVPGNHYSVMNPPYLSVLQDEMRAQFSNYACNKGTLLCAD